MGSMMPPPVWRAHGGSEAAMPSPARTTPARGQHGAAPPSPRRLSPEKLERIERLVARVDASKVREGSELLSKAMKEDTVNHAADDIEKAFKASQATSKCTFQRPGWPQMLKIVTSSAAQFGLTPLPDAIREKYNASVAMEASSDRSRGWMSSSASSSSRLDQQPVVCLCGIFPNIRRAWATVDNAIFLWRFDCGGTDPNVVQYEGQEQAITAVALAKAKSGVFWEAIEHVLVVCTSVEVTLVGVVGVAPQQSKARGSAKAGHGEVYDSINLQPLPLYSVATDTVMMTSICTTAEGRIFLGGEDGHIYELLYSVSDNWRNKRCSLVCHSNRLLNMIVPSFLRTAPSAVEQIVADEERGILYARMGTTGIQVFDLGQNCSEAPKKVAEIVDIIDGARKAGPHGLGRQLFAREGSGSRSQTQSTAKPSDLVHIAALERSVSESLHLVGIMGDGRRIFLSTNSHYRTPFSRTSKVPRPSELRAQYVQKAPDRPPFGSHKGVFGVGSPHRQLHSDKLVVEYGFYKEGVHLFSCEAEDSSHTQLFLVCRDFTLGSGPGSMHDLVELVTMEVVRGHVCAVSELDAPQVLRRAVQVEEELKCNFSEILHAPMLPAKRYSIVSTAGTLVVEKLRPVDLLQNLLEGGNKEHIRNFFQSYGLVESACMCLIFAAPVSRSDTANADFWAEELKTAFGMNPDEIEATLKVITKPSFVVEEAKKIFADADFTGRPIQEDEVLDAQGAMNINSINFDMGGPHEPKIRFSGRHDGFCLLAGRLLRPLWDVGIFSISSSSATSTSRSSNAILEVSLAMQPKSMRLLEERMSALVDYMLEYTQHQANSENRGYLTDYTRRTRQKVEVAIAKEQESIMSMCGLLQRSYETLRMVRMLHEKTGGNLSVLVNRLEGAPKEYFARVDRKIGENKGSLHELVVMDEGENIVRSLISSLMSYKMDISSGAIHLKEISRELEVSCPTLFQADDRVFYDARMTLRSARTASGVERSQLIQSALKMLLQVPLVVNIHAVFSELIDLKAYEGAVDLVIQAAAMRDPSNIASLQDDNRAKEYQNLREECYILVIEALNQLKTSSMTDVSLATSPLTPSKADGNTHDATTTYNRILSHCLASSDICFHRYIYMQLMGMGLDAQNNLIQQNPAYLEGFLREQAGLPSGPAPVHNVIKKLPVIAAKAVESLEVLGRLYVHRHMFPQAAYLQLLLAERLNGSIAEEGEPQHESFVTLERRQQHLLDGLRLAKSRGQHQSFGSPGLREDLNGTALLDTLQCKVEVIAFQMSLAESISTQGNKYASELYRLAETEDVTSSHVERLLELVNKGVHDNMDALLRAELGHSLSPSAQEVFASLFSSYASCATKVMNLRMTFFSLEDLYNDFARPECMWPLCLEMLHLANFSDVQMLKDHWDMCLYAAVTESVDGQSLTAACAVVKELGQKFYPNDVAFPIQHIVQRLEEVAAGVWPVVDQPESEAPVPLAQGDSYELIPTTLLSVCGASERLRYVYEGLIERHTTTDVVKYQYLKSLTVVLEFAKNEILKSKDEVAPGMLSANKPLREAGLLVELCDKYALKAQSLNLDQDLEVQHLVQRFEGIKNLS